MSQPNLTLIGIESYLNPDSSVFDNISERKGEIYVLHN